jgi:ribonuclease-3
MATYFSNIHSRLVYGGNFFWSLYRRTRCLPLRLSLYVLAFTHSSATPARAGAHMSNERLEFLGDAILGSIVAAYLYRQYPAQSEGFLTSMRSKIVSRRQLNELAGHLQLQPLIRQSQKSNSQAKSINGNTLEALVGAIYLDRGYNTCRWFVEKRLLAPHIHLDELSRKAASNKSALLEWAAKEKCSVWFSKLEETGKSHERLYEMAVFLDEILLAKGQARSKKKAEEDAACAALEKLSLTYAQGNPGLR